MPRAFKSQLLPWLSIAALVALTAVPLGLLLWLTFFTDTFVIAAITITDARPHTTEAVRQIIAAHLDQNRWHRNIFFTRAQTLEQEIVAELPQIRTVHLARKLPGTLKAIVQEKTAALLFLSNATYYFVDELGIAYEEARLETLPGTVLPIVKNQDAAAPVTIGAPVVATSFVTFVQFMAKELPGATDAAVAEIRIPSLSAREVHLLLNNNWIIRFDVTRPPASQLDTLRKLLTTTVPSQDQPRLEYIDLRIPDRVYYKTREVVPEKLKVQN